MYFHYQSVLVAFLLPFSASAGAINRPPPGCALDNCLFTNAIPSSYRPAASAFCSAIVKHGPAAVTANVTVVSTRTVTVTPAALPVTQTSAVSFTVTAGTVCTASSVSTASLTTSMDYRSRLSAAGTARKRSPQHPQMPDWFLGGCRKCSPNALAQKVSSACSCFLGTSTVTASMTRTSIVTVTAVALPTTVVVNAPVTVTTTICTSTQAGVVYRGACGTSFATFPTASTSGTLTCSQSVPTPSSNVRFRIEGNDSEGTIFEDCILAGPRNITTSSGGTHLCDGTNNGANPSPGTTPTDQIDAAAKKNGFGYDGTWSAPYQDFFITSISQSTQTGDQYWGVLVNGQYTPTGGCQSEVVPGDRSLWAFDAFNKNVFLKVSPDYAVAKAGSGTVTVTITDDMSGSPVQGASFAGQSSASNGQVTFAVPSSPGCYQMKATKASALRSNAFYLTVVDSF